MLQISLLFFAISLCIAGYGLYLVKHQKELDSVVEEQNRFLAEKKVLLDKDIISAKEQLEFYEKQLNTTQDNIKIVLNNQQELSQKAFENYCEILDAQYKKAEDEYTQSKELLEESYSKMQLNLLKQKEATERDLEKLEATRAAIIQAQLKEKEIQERLSFYCLQVTPTDLADIQKLEDIKPKLNNPRILSMLIWSTFFQKPMNTLCNNVIGATVKSGIYKITNQKDNMCYIGQAVDLARRWKDHAKCGLGIDTPASNKLYQAMIKDGIWNFSFEVLEECPSAQLNEKEKYYIQLYKSYEYGYNSNKGITK